MPKRPFSPRPAEGLKYRNAVAMVRARMERSPHAAALRHKVDGAWRTLSWRGVWDAARELAAGLVELGVSPGDRVALLAPTRLEWILLDFGIAMAGAISVPIYPSLTANNVRFIAEDAGCSVVIVDELGLWKPVVDGGPLPGDPTLVTIEPPSSKQDTDVTTLADVRSRGAKALMKNDAADKQLAKIEADLGLGDDLSYVYTSGTTGQPKGVVLTHRNFVYEAWAIRNVVPVDDTDEQLLVLPLSHIFARHLVWGAVEQGAVTAIGEGEEHIATNMLEVAPTFMGSVPRMYERAYTQVVRRVVGRNQIAQRAFALAMDVGRKMSGYRQRGQSPPTSLSVRYAVADRTFFSRIREAFGGRLRFFVAGGAPLPKDVAEFFHACGVLILEGYGLSETTGATNVNRPDRFRFGTVGPAMPGCEVRVADDGEVLVRGHNVMARYHNLPEDTEAAFDEHGFFRTGDIGEIVDGFLKITDRKKSLFKTTAGKYVAPRMIEGRLRVHEGIAHALVLGDGRPYAVAVLSLDTPAMMRRSEREGLGCRTYEDLVAHPRVRQICQAAVDEVNASLARYEHVRRFALAPKPFAIETGELTPTRKVKRQVVSRQYRALVDELYRQDASSPLPGKAASA